MWTILVLALLTPVQTEQPGTFNPDAHLDTSQITHTERTQP